jgi:hypothetical protein
MNVRDALDAIDRYMAQRSEGFFGPILGHLREVGEARSATELETHFKRNFNVEGLTIACEYLADLKKISKVSIARQLTSRSNVQVEEMAFLHTWEIPDEYSQTHHQ